MAALTSSSSSADPTPEVPHELRCPITCDLFEDPVLAPDGFNYERAHIEKWFQDHHTSPKTNAVLGSTVLTPYIFKKNRFGRVQ